jgi:hypothetical protein
MNLRKNVRIAAAAFLLLLGTGQHGATAQSVLNEVRTTCSQYALGQFLFSECESEIAYLDPQSSQVYHCHGRHQVVSHETAIHHLMLDAVCKAAFQPFAAKGAYRFNDVTASQTLPLTKKNVSMRPDLVVWVADKSRGGLDYCSKFVAGAAGSQNRCVGAVFAGGNIATAP